METRIFEDATQNFGEKVLRFDDQAIGADRVNGDALEEELLKSTRKEKITLAGESWLIKTIMQRPEVAQIESRIQVVLFYQEHQAVSERIQIKTVEKKAKTAEEKREKVEQEQKSLETEANTVMAVEKLEERLQTFAAKTEERSEVATEISVDEANESKIDVEEKHPLKEFI